MNYSKLIGNKPDRNSTPGRGTRPRSISRRLAAGLTAITVLISIVMIAVIYFSAIREQEADLMKKADTYRNYLVGTLEQPLWEYDDNTINTIGRTFLQNDLAVSLLIKDTSGRVVFFGETSHEADVIKRTGEIYHRGELMGEIEICFTERYVKEVGRRLLATYAVTMLFVSMSLALLTHLLLRIFLKRPLEALNNIVQPYFAGIYDSPISELPYAEFQEFGRTLARMGETIRSQMKIVIDAEKKYRRIVDTAHEGIWQLGLDAMTTSVNTRMAEMLGYSTEEMIGRPLAFFMFEEDLPDHLKRMANRRRGLSENYECRFRRRDGKTVWTLAAATPIFDDQHRFQGSFAMLTDITDRKRAEESLRHAHDELEQRVQERTRELRDVHRQLMEAARVAGREEISTTILHNVGNMVSSLNVAAEVMRGQLHKSRTMALRKATGVMRDHEADLARYLTEDPKGKVLVSFLPLLADELCKENERLLMELSELQKNLDHINNIITVQQSLASRTLQVIEELDVCVTIDEALRIQMQHASDIEVVRDYVPLPPLHTDRHKLLQILINLLSNARYALRAAPPPRRLEVSVRDVGPCVQVQVKDTGIGIPPEKMKQIFQYGFTDKKDGHGFGLHSCALHARAMGGSLVAHSDGADKGAVFTLELPWAPREREPSAPEPHPH